MKSLRGRALRRNALTISSAMVQSAMYPCSKGRTATSSPGVRPSIWRAACPTSKIFPVRRSTATTDGSSSTMPRPRTATCTDVVPRSMAMSRQNPFSTALHPFPFVLLQSIAERNRDIPTKKGVPRFWRLDQVFGVRQKAAATTCAAPAARSVCAASSRVAPVVRMSSMTRIFFPATSWGRGTE